MGKLIDLLPSGYEYHMGTMTSEPTEFRMKLSSKSEVQKWLKKFEEKSYSTWRIERTYSQTLKYSIFKLDLHCHLNTNRRVLHKRVSKHTSCPARLKIDVERYTENDDNLYSWPPVDPVSRQWPCFIRFIKDHNHPMQCASVLKYRDMSEETRQKLCDLFHRGHTPSSALHYLKTELFLEHPEDYLRYDKDGRFTPSLSKCTHLFNKECKQQDGSRSREAMLNNLQQFVEEYSTTSGGKVISGTTEDDHVYVCICTPLMARVHATIKESAETVYVNVAGCKDPKLRRVYLFTTSTPAGGLPLAIIITDVEKEALFYLALKELIESCLPEESFYGQKYPKIIITDNDLKERKSIQALFPDSTLLLCQFHLLKSMWTCLSNTTKDNKSDCQELFFLFKLLVYSSTEEELQRVYYTLMESEVAKQYPPYIGYVEKWWPEKEAWATCYRSGLSIRGNTTTNYIEVRILKDVILQRFRAFKLMQLVDFLLKSYESHVEKRLVSFANDCPGKSHLRNFLNVTSAISLDEIQEHKTRKDCFTVPSETKENVSYAVDIDVCICECSHGNKGGVCKHVSAVFKKQNQNIVCVAGESLISTRKIMLQVATGKEPSDESLLPLPSEVPSQPAVPLVAITPSLSAPFCQVAPTYLFLVPVNSKFPSQQALPLLQQPPQVQLQQPLQVLPQLQQQPQASPQLQPQPEALPQLQQQPQASPQLQPQPEAISQLQQQPLASPQLQPQPEAISQLQPQPEELSQLQQQPQVLPQLQQQPEVTIIAPSLLEPICEVTTEKGPSEEWTVPLISDVSQQTLPISPQQPEVGPSEREPMTLDLAIKEEMQEKLKALCDRIMQYTERNPDVFVPAIRKMSQNAKEFASTETSLASALNTFGESTKNTVAGVKHSKSTPVLIAPRVKTQKVICLPSHGMTPF